MVGSASAFALVMSVHGYVVGEHGHSEVLVWSQPTIAGLNLDEIAKLPSKRVSDADRQQIDEDIRRAAYQIITGKGAARPITASAVQWLASRTFYCTTNALF